ncbi:type III-A CRISPR-associated protein Cas10/Csm1 [Desulfobulbus oligotrophicus]|uniref:CRISPR system single-strand-specific deoxyribonuclease Cas10/Csm1 (subtype III-A) n=1 Tax=Desulfobulbus oligotrophicus TaxID=1909699 RepID=A0A7T6ARA1_9BACT|nr:type III-A CRISPR-associated protein Cas10/Csm1 [Desulfobulbus oligotrophicus]QQG66591.1 type III-A CRISPR-associated protein Cas10/Csm1 [Desulfobulbus oligotrophicus]
MDKELLQAISLAGMLHDIGKFAERADAVESGDQDMIRQEYRYSHAFHTEQALKLLFPEEQLNKSFGDLTECTVMNLAARHHKPRNVFELMITESDRIAAGHERAKGDADSDYDTGGRERKSKTPMLSIMARIRLKKHADEQGSSDDWRYRINNEGLAYSSDEYHRLFPVSSQTYKAEQVRRDYQAHWQAFRRTIADNSIGLDLFGHADTIIDVCRAHLWCLPASTRKEEMPDVSLYDHQKATAALAASMYWYHAEHSTLQESAITNRQQTKFLLFCGDISGIQQFIYKLSSKGAYKTLKGRSFFVQFLSELLADRFIQTLGLTKANILYSSGGKFYLLLPNTEGVQTLLSDLQEEVNTELLKKFSGDLYVRFSRISLSGDDLTRQSGRTLCQIWDELTRRLVAEDTQRYAATVSKDYAILFGTGSGDQQSCVVCHRSTTKDNDTCPTCRDMKTLGTSLPRSTCIVVTTEPLATVSRPNFKLFNRFVYLSEKIPADLRSGKARLYALNNADFSTLALDCATRGELIDCTPFLAGSMHTFADTFDEIADQAQGVKRLGILRMDVDSLGKIFSEGLQNYSHETIHDKRFHSLGRITTLSWQLTLFFSGILPQLIAENAEWRDRVTVVYSGGDDLFLIGAWDALPEIALTIQQRFAAFTCNNPSCTLSGGLVITPGKFPIYKSADMAGEAEHRAKKHETTFKNGRLTDKASITFLETPMHWQEFEILSRLYTKVLIIAQNPQHASLVRRLRDIAASWRESCAYLQQQDRLSIDAIKNQLQAEKWRWRMVYTLARYAAGKPSLSQTIQELQQFITSEVGTTDRQGIELLGVLARWCELRLRNEKIKETV